jgi:hypothetical protein
LGAVLCCITAVAQQTTGSILGSVTDAQSGAVINAPVTIRNSETGLTRSASTNERGEYRFEFLPPGDYEIDVKAAGFRAFRQTGVGLAVGQFARVDAHLEIGETSNTITV